jgi:excinuclease ABC subunit B
LKESKNYQDGALKEAIKVHYLHSDIETLKRSDILDDLRLGKYEVLVGINLLREGLDLPEVSLVAILDADKEGFLRSETALIQTMGRAARHLQGSVIMYADNLTGSMKRAIAEVNRRREIQVKYNLKHGITPQTIKKPVREKLVEADEAEERITKEFESLLKINFDELTPYDRKLRVKKMEKEMRSAAKNLEFEKAAKIRDLVATLSG